MPAHAAEIDVNSLTSMDRSPGERGRTGSQGIWIVLFSVMVDPLILGYLLLLGIVPTVIQMRLHTFTKPRNLAGNPDSPQAVIFLASITDVMMGS